MKARGELLVTHLASDGASSRRPMPLVVPLLLLVMLLLLLLLPLGCDGDKRVDTLVTSAGQALQQGDFAKAEKLAVEAYQADAQAPAALKIAGDAAAQQDAFDRALEYYAKIPEMDRRARGQGCTGAARVLMVGKFQLSKAESKFREALSWQPDDSLALDGLSFLLAAQGAAGSRRRSTCDCCRVVDSKPDICWVSVSWKTS